MIECLVQNIFVKFGNIVSLKVERELLCGSVNKIEAKPETVSTCVLEQCGIRITEINHFKLVVHHAGK